MVPPLPYRPLEVRGHGVYDPQKGAFYPFVARGSGPDTVVAPKSGHHIFIHTVLISISNSGDAAAATGGIRFADITGDMRYFYVTVPASVAGQTGSCVSVSQTMDILTAVGAGVNVMAAGSASRASVVYAYIPADTTGEQI